MEQQEHSDISTVSLSPAAEFAVGGGIGLLVGLLMGLAMTEMVGGVIAGLTALLATFLGLEVKSAATSAPHAARRAWRMAGFGIVCAVSLLLGMTIRTHNLLAPTLVDQVSSWQAAGFDNEQARQLVAYQLLGVAPEHWRTTNEGRVAGRTASALFAGESSSSCGDLAPDRYSSAAEWLNAFRLADGEWPAVAQQLEASAVKPSTALLTAIWTLVCKKGSP
ncbi:MAG: hypothetical protein FD130_662 [Halothiobacillaceae bacterium]|nr:MAG: hypothetical protein FD130_662 [Halothiobacillaceae bacterium]